MSRARWLALAALGAGLASCGGEVAQETEAHPVVVQPVVARDLEERIEAAGELVARQHAVVAAEVGGRITAVLRDEGSDVAEGEAILAIDPERRELEADDARAQLAELQAAAAEAGREQQRIRVLHEKGVASQARLEQTETQLRLSRSRLDAARARLGMSERALADAQVRAPFAGVVAERLAEVGEFVQPGTRLFELVALDPIEVEFRLPEADASRVEVGQTVDLRVAPYPDKAFRAEVVFVSPTIDTQSRTLLVRGALPNAERLLRPGLFAGVDLGVASRNGVAMIPEEAVLQRADGEVAFRVHDGNKVQRVLLETGIHRGGEVEIRSGLEVGDRVVVSGHYALAEGMQVEPRTAEGEPETAVGGTPRLAETETP